MDWTPQITFGFAYAAAALTALGGVCLSNKSLSIRVVIGTMLVYGGIGSSAGMFLYLKWFAGNDSWTAITTAILVGGGAIKKKDITDVMRRILGVKNGISQDKD